MNIEVLNPDINESYSKFTVIDSKIRFSLDTIKNVSSNAIEEIIKIRNISGKFKSFIDFCEKVASENVNKKCIESLIKAGCFNEIEKVYTKLDLLENFENIIDNMSNSRRNNYANQLNLFDTTEEKISFQIKKSNRKVSQKE